MSLEIMHTSTDLHRIVKLANYVALIVCFGCSNSPIDSKQDGKAPSKAEVKGGDIAKGPAASDLPKADPKVYRSTDELLADMPKSEYPFGGAIEASKARKWLRANVVGRTIEWTSAVTNVTDQGNGPFDVTLTLAGDRHTYAFLHTDLGNGGTPAYGLRFGPGFKLDGQRCGGLLVECRPFGPGGLGLRSSTTVHYNGCTQQEDLALRQLNGKKEKGVVFRATITAVDLTGKDGILHEISSKEWLSTAFVFQTTVPSANGFLPEACKPKNKK